jgi:light-regulated signal transduction histidine kinase (bacteriophytochrome)
MTLPASAISFERLIGTKYICASPIWGIFQTLAPRDKVEGTGIGLSVVKKIVESRGGKVSLESAPGEGATFRFVWAKTLRQRFS